MSYVPQFIEPEQDDDESDFEEPDDDEDDVTVNDVCRNGQAGLARPCPDQR